jgi:hypothetical protein
MVVEHRLSTFRKAEKLQVLEACNDPEGWSEEAGLYCSMPFIDSRYPPTTVGGAGRTTAMTEGAEGQSKD